MYLKEIKISGFKSFADKIDLSLDNKITCIVGPNGSGKSNVVDAIRWVLGEQSVKSLRGDNAMSDVIFSGSKTRKPLNLASVTLVFDNSDNYIKVPYTEISVTRKVYKSGENEYFINNDKCRLKDINELFLDSGMGKESYNIISQGEIGKIISDSSMERRSILEETAGVLKYKKRKEEALKKLAKTNDNLARINDITDELSSSIEPLKEQSEKAKIYLDAKEKLEQIEVALITHDLDKINFEYKKKKETKEVLENKIIELNANNSKKDATLEIERQELEKLEQDYSTLNKQLLELVKKCEKLNGEKTLIQERAKYNAEDIKVHENVSNLKEQELKLNNEIISLKKEVEVINLDLNSSNNILNEYRKKLTDFISVKSNIDNEINILNKKIVDLSYKISSLNDYINQGGSTNPSVKRIVNNPKFKGIHNTMASLLEVSDEYSLALEVSLGAAKDYVIIDRKEQTKEVITFLKEQNLGRVTFYPLDVIKPRGIDQNTLEILEKESGYINTLVNLVAFDDVYYNVFNNVLGAVIVARDLDSANYLSKITYNKYKIVTLTGEVVNVGGSITGGAYKLTRSIISEKYELQELIRKDEEYKQKLKQLEDKANQAQAEEFTYKNKLLALTEENITIKNTLNFKKESLNALEDNLQKVLDELSGYEALIDNNLSLKEEQIIKKYYEVDQEKNALEQNLKELLKKKEQKSSAIEEMEAEYRISNSKIREVEKELKQEEIALSKAEVKMDNLLNNLTENYAMTYEKAKANYILEIPEDLARKQVNSYKNEIKNIGVVNLGAIEEYERVNTRYEFLSKQKEDLNKAMDTLLSIIDELDKVMKEEFIKTFREVNDEFSKTFKDLFNGGLAKLELTDPSNILETGIDIIVSPPGKKLTTISLLSGGEKSLTAISLLFAILRVKKVPFCLFDEVEAALDEANVDNFGKYLNNYRNHTQFLIITHKKRTMEYADTLYGITMQESGVSKLVSVKLMN